MGLYANTMEGYKVYISAVPSRKIIFDGKVTELVLIFQYEIDEKHLENIEKKRNETKKRSKKSFRDTQLEQTLELYYNNNLDHENGVNRKGLEEGYENNNIYLAEKKRCGIRQLN